MADLTTASALSGFGKATYPRRNTQCFLHWKKDKVDLLDRAFCVERTGMFFMERPGGRYVRTRVGTCPARKLFYFFVDKV